MRLRSLSRGAGPGDLGAEYDGWRAGLKGGARSCDCLEPWRTARLLRCRDEDRQRGKEIPGERDVLHQREDQAIRGLRGVGLWVGRPWMAGRPDGAPGAARTRLSGYRDRAARQGQSDGR